MPNSVYYKSLDELRAEWTLRAARVREVLVRVDPTGMTRPPRDPDERAFLAARNALGPFIEKEIPAKKD